MAKAGTEKSARKTEETKSEGSAPTTETAADASSASEAAKISAQRLMANQKRIPDAAEVRANPDANLSASEVKVLYEKLIEERNRVLSGFDRHVSEALEDGDVLADEIDIAQRSTDQAWLFRFADKERKLLIEIEAALEKMRDGDYGLCEGTDEPIGFKRLELRPWTRYSVAYKELLEREKAQHTR